MQKISSIPPLHTQREMKIRVVTEKNFEFDAVRKRGHVESFLTGFLNSPEQKTEVLNFIKNMSNKEVKDPFVYGYFNLKIKKEFFLPNTKTPFHTTYTTKQQPIIYLFQPNNEKLGTIKVLSTGQVKKMRRWSNYHLYGKYHVVQIKDAQIDDCWSINQSIIELGPIKTISIAC